MRRFLLAVFCGLMVVMMGSRSRAAEKGQAVKEELARIQGTWQLVYAETDGKTAPGERIQAVRVEIKGNSHSVYIGDKQVVHDVGFTLDATATPRTSDNTINDGPDKGKKIHGIYELEGDTLASCVAKVGEDRPRKFATTPGSGHTFRVFKRVRPDEDPKEKAVRDELIRFGGTWRFAELETGGTKVPIGSFAENRLILQGDRFLASDPRETGAGYYKIDPTRVPKTIDVVFTSGSPKGTTFRGIYELTDDTYKTCFSVDDQPRPEKFESTPGSTDVVEVLKRVKPESAQDPK
jgi:uncharacterized protein (TIGR03067 family)